INFQVPFEAPLIGSVPVIVTRDSIPSASQSADMAEYAPGVFTYARNATTLDPIIVHLDNRLVTPDDPASSNEFLIIYATGVGNFTVSFSPNPVTPGSDGNWHYTIILQETGGVGVTLTKLTASSDLTSAIQQAFGSTHIGPNGTLRGNFVSSGQANDRVWVVG